MDKTQNQEKCWIQQTEQIYKATLQNIGKICQKRGKIYMIFYSSIGFDSCNPNKHQLVYNKIKSKVTKQAILQTSIQLAGADEM